MDPVVGKLDLLMIYELTEGELANYLGYCKGRTPLLFENIKADASVAINVGVEHLGSEGNLHKHIVKHTFANISQHSSKNTSPIHPYIKGKMKI